MDYSKLESAARKLVENAKPGILRYGDKIYTLVFNQREWVYDVFEDGFLLVRFNTKKITQAKKWLKEYLDN